MLSSIKDSLASLPEEDFGQFYQHFVMESQDKIIDSDLRVAYSHYSSNSLLGIISGLNELTEELKIL